MDLSQLAITYLITFWCNVMAFLLSLLFIYLLRMQRKTRGSQLVSQTTMFSRSCDVVAAKLVILPAYEPLLFFLAAAFLVQTLLLGVPGPYPDEPAWYEGSSFTGAGNGGATTWSSSGLYFAFWFTFELVADGFCLALLQRYPSRSAFMSAFQYAALYAVVSSGIATLGFNWALLGVNELTQKTLDSLFAGLPCILYSSLLIFPRLAGGRASIRLYSIFSLTWRVASIIALNTASSGSQASLGYESALGAAITATRSVFLPIAIYLSLLLETSYWRNLAGATLLKLDKVAVVIEKTEAEAAVSSILEFDDAFNEDDLDNERSSKTGGDRVRSRSKSFAEIGDIELKPQNRAAKVNFSRDQSFAEILLDKDGRDYEASDSDDGGEDLGIETENSSGGEEGDRDTKRGTSFHSTRTPRSRKVSVARRKSSAFQWDAGHLPRKSLVVLSPEGAKKTSKVADAAIPLLPSATTSTMEDETIAQPRLLPSWNVNTTSWSGLFWPFSGNESSANAKTKGHQERKKSRASSQNDFDDIDSDADEDIDEATMIHGSSEGQFRPLSAYFKEEAEQANRSGGQGRGRNKNLGAAKELEHVSSFKNDNARYLVDFALLEIGDFIDRGGTSNVYSGRYQGKRVAIKMFRPERIDAHCIAFFHKENAVSAAFSHPNIIRYFGLCVSPPHISLVFEMCARGSLWNVIDALIEKNEEALYDQQRGVTNNRKNVNKGYGTSSSSNQIPSGPLYSLSWKRRLRMARDAAKAIAYLHSFDPPYIHRDVKSQNFLVTDDYRLKLSDFGESRVRAKGKASPMTGEIGTTHWMAPEMFANEEYTESVDIYGLGIVLWELASERHPYEGLSDYHISHAVSVKGLRPKIPNNVPQEYARIMQACWQQSSSRRPTAQEVLSSLEALLQNSKQGDTFGSFQNDSAANSVPTTFGSVSTRGSGTKLIGAS
jgi:serine/threonine protein kinase